MHMRWPGEPGSALLGSGRGRDLLTDPSGVACEVSRGELQVTLDPRTREVLAVDTVPSLPALRGLVGQCGGLRARTAELVPEEVEAGSVLALLLDDLSGTGLIAPFVLTRSLSAAAWAGIFGDRVPPSGVCTGYREGATAHRAGEPRDRTRPVAALTSPADPDAWHALTEFAEPSTRRVRRIDAWHEGDALLVDAWFQDSASEPGGGRVAVHEYRLRVAADARTGTLTEIAAVAGALPFPECPLAADNLDRLVGVPLADLRRTAPRLLRGPDGCTHLTDAARALREVPAMLAAVHENLSP